MGRRAKPHGDAKQYAAAAATILRVLERRDLGVTWVSLAKQFHTDRSALHRWITLNPAQHASERRLIFRIGEWAMTLDRIQPVGRLTPGISASLDPSRLATSPAIIDTPPMIDDPYKLCDLAMQHAELGNADLGFTLLAKSIEIAGTDRIETSIHLLPMLIYIGYRFLTPAKYRLFFERPLRSLLRKGETKTKCDPRILALAAAQIACALNEGDAAKEADMIFNSREVKSLFTDNVDIRWPHDQLMRNYAIFEIKHTSRPTFGWDQLKVYKNYVHGPKARALATVEQTFQFRRDKPGKAWEVIRFQYESDRDILSNALNRIEQKGSMAPESLMHLAASVYCGVLDRWMAKELYPKSDLESDLYSIGRCIRIYHKLPIGDPVFYIPKGARPLSDELTRLTEKCAREKMHPIDVGLFMEMARMLIEL